jgi:predicted DCC family thiol-disulfide oxidoreductase YuxK
MKTLEILQTKFPGVAVIAYDGDCPMCRNYVRLVKLRETAGSMKIFNLRDLSPEERRSIQSEYDLDSGMLFMIDGHIYYGDQALQKMAVLSGERGTFNHMNRIFFSNPAAAKFIYPALACGRGFLLKMLGRKKFRE